MLINLRIPENKHNMPQVKITFFKNSEFVIEVPKSTVVKKTLMFGNARYKFLWTHYKRKNKPHKKLSRYYKKKLGGKK